jgi:hypothetical protein
LKQRGEARRWHWQPGAAACQQTRVGRLMRRRLGRRALRVRHLALPCVVGLAKFKPKWVMVLS